MIAHVGGMAVEEPLLPLVSGVSAAKGGQPAFLASKLEGGKRVRAYY